MCDNEGAFSSQDVLDLLTAHNISLRIITDKRHTALSIIDRFIRTLRDMNIPTVKTQHQSDNNKYRDFSIKRMNKLLHIYNNTIHNATGYTPADMNNNEQLEKYLLIRKILNTKDSFSKMNIKYAYAILRDLMIPEENLKEVYIKILNECDIIF